LDLVVYDKENASLTRISEVKLSHAFHRIPFDFYRSGVAMFMGEVVGKAIYDNYQNASLFEFLAKAILVLDGESLNLSTFPHVFLLQLSQFLVFSPADAGEFYEQLHLGIGSFPVSQEEMAGFDQLLESSLDQGTKIPGSVRRKLMDHLPLHYKLHLDTFSEIKSVKVLMQMM